MSEQYQYSPSWWNARPKLYSTSWPGPTSSRYWLRKPNACEGGGVSVWPVSRRRRDGRRHAYLHNLMLAVVGLTRHGAVQIRHSQAEVDDWLVRGLLVRAQQVNCDRHMSSQHPAALFTMAIPLTDRRLEAP